MHLSGCKAPSRYSHRIFHYTRICSGNKGGNSCRSLLWSAAYRYANTSETRLKSSVNIGGNEKGRGVRNYYKMRKWWWDLGFCWDIPGYSSEYPPYIVNNFREQLLYQVLTNEMVPEPSATPPQIFITFSQSFSCVILLTIILVYSDYKTDKCFDFCIS